MHIKLIIFICVLLLSAGYAYWDISRMPTGIVNEDNTISSQKNYRSTVPDFSFQSLNGQKHKLYDFEGKVIILNFWATWCAPCIAEFPILLEQAKKRSEDTVLIAISVDENQDNIEKFFKKHRFHTDLDNVLIAHDPGKFISQDLFQTTVYPEPFIIGPSLKLEHKIIGAEAWDRDDTLYLLDKLAM